MSASCVASYGGNKLTMPNKCGWKPKFALLANLSLMYAPPFSLYTIFIIM